MSKKNVVIGVLIFFILFIVSGIKTMWPMIVSYQVKHLAFRPPMGWNPWNSFRCSDEVNEKLIRQTVDTMITSGMRDAGYKYVVLDDCWQVARDEFGIIVADSNKFPSGMKALGDYIHSKRMKFGIYTSAGRATCEKRPGSFGFERQDVRTYAQWGVDYIKVDWCGIEYLDTETQYKKWRKAIEKSGRPMVLSIAIANIEQIDHNNVWEWGNGVGHLWRTTRDILDYWPDILRIIDQNSQYARFSGPGAWNDADMLQVGNGGMTTEEYKTHFSMWAMMASPLMAGNDLRRMTDDVKNILTNPEIIAINQDALGAQGTLVGESGDEIEIWLKPLSDPNHRAIALFNRSEKEEKMILNWNDIGLGSVSAQVRDLWFKKDMGSFSQSYETRVPAHGVVVLKITNTEVNQ